MPYVALKPIEVKGRAHRQRGEVVPEAQDWTNPGLWERAGHVKFVPDSEIRDGMWVHAKDYGGRGAGQQSPVEEHQEAAPEPHVEEAEVDIEEPEASGPPAEASGQESEEVMPRRGSRRRRAMR